MIHFLWKVGNWFPKLKGAGASLARQPFFLLDNQVVQVFRLKDRLVILRTVMYEVCGRICS